MNANRTVRWPVGAMVLAGAALSAAGCGLEQSAPEDDGISTTSALAASCKTSCTAACNTQAVQEIDAKRAANAFLGNPLEPHKVLSGCGYYRHYQNGSIYLHADTGARLIYGAIREKWGTLGWERGVLGYPSTDEMATPDGRGRFNHFQGGSIYWTATTGAVAVLAGPIRDKWVAMGSERSTLGYPVQDTGVTPDGVGKFGHFEGGSIYWSAPTGAHEIRGEIRQRWAELGWEKSALGYPTSDETASGTDGRRSTFSGGEIVWNPDPAGVSFFAQNMALLPPPAAYNGTERAAAVAGIINFLRTTRPSVAGLSEAFVDSERQQIRTAVADVYPFWLQGPDEDDFESDGGLLLLSRFPMLANSQHIYRSCYGEDCISNKGILHALIDGPGAADFDVYLSHLQNPDVLHPEFPHSGPGNTASAKVKAQLSAFSDFVAATRRRSVPAILLGDFNVKASDTAAHSDMMARFNHPMDAWVVAGNGTQGITSGDPFSDFGETGAVISATDPRRHQSGNRIDYILGYNGNLIRPTFSGTRVVVVKTASGRDVSDHYGLLTTVPTIRELRVTYNRNPTEVTATLYRFHCIKETDGSTGLGSDEVDFQMTVDPALGTTTTTPRTILEEVVDVGTRRLILSQSTVVKSFPGSSIAVGVQGWEVDPSPLGETGRSSLGTATLNLARDEIFEGFVSPVEKFVSLTSEAGGHYVVGVRISSR